MSERPENPYSAPQGSAAAPAVVNPRHSAYVWQVQLAAGLMLGQAVLELFFTACMFFMYFFLPPVPPGTLNPQERLGFQYVIYYMLICGIVMSIVSILRLVAGILAIQYRGRVFAMVANVVGLLSLFTVYCLPSAFIVCVYSLIILIREEVARAFSMRAAGSTIADIKGHFGKQG